MEDKLRTAYQRILITSYATILCLPLKQKKAAELGVKVISEEEFARRFGDPYDDDVDFEHNLKDIDFDEDDEEGYDF